MTVKPFPELVTFGRVMSPFVKIVIAEVVAMELKVKLPVPVKLTALLPAGVRAIVPPTE